MVRASRAGAALVALWAGASLCACSTAGSGPVPLAGRTPGDARRHAYNAPYIVHGRRYVPADEPRYDEVGLASWYSYESGRRTADGEPFGGADQVTAAHRTLPIPSEVEVTNLENGRRIRVRLNDRGPFVQDRLIDLSREAARQLDFLGRGTARVRVRYLGPAQPWPAPVFASASPHRLPKREETPHEVSSLELVADLPAVSASPR